MLVLSLSKTEACRCNGNTEYDFALGTEIGECRTLYPLGSPNGRPWCYINEWTSGCPDRQPSSLRPGRYFSLMACAAGQLKKKRSTSYGFQETLPWFAGSP